MSKFCLKCGKELDDNMKFCNVCGAEVGNADGSNGAKDATASGINTDELKQKASDAAQKTAKVVGETANKMVDAIPDEIKNKVGGAGKAKIIVLAGAAVIAFLIIALLASTMSGGPKKAAKKYINAMYTGDVKDYKKVMIPDLVEYLEDEYDEDYYDEVLENRIDYLEDEYGDDIKVKKLKVKSSKKLSDKKCDNYEESLDDYYDIDVKIKAAYKVKGTFTIKGDDDDEDMEFEAYVIKVKGKYYVYDMDISED